MMPPCAGPVVNRKGHDHAAGTTAEYHRGADGASAVLIFLSAVRVLAIEFIGDIGNRAREQLGPSTRLVEV
jgi:hypothetical protein